MSKKSTQLHPISDAVSERLLITGLIHYGSKFYYDICTHIKSKDFYFPENRVIFSSIENLISKENIDYPNKLLILNQIGKEDKDAINKYQLSEYLDILTGQSITEDSLKLPLKIVARLSLSRQLKQGLLDAVTDIESVSGTESITDIISKAEQPIVKVTTDIVSPEQTINLASDINEYIEYLGTEKPPVRGIPTGFNLYDRAIGGGIRFPGVHLIGGRAKSGKSFKLLNIAHNVVRNDIPVLYLDTELDKITQQTRWTALNSGIPINDIENGSFADNEVSKRKMQAAISNMKKAKFFYHNIAGMHYQEWISIMRKWIIKEVGLGQDGKSNICLIVLDYIKMMNIEHAGNFAEHQYLGQTISDLQNFANKYCVGILSAVQLNRDGILREDQGVVAGSDKLVGLCSSLTILKQKQAEDYAGDPPENGDRKLIPIACRYGGGLRDGEYINLRTDLSRGIMREGNTNLYNRERAQMQTSYGNEDNNISL